MRKFLTGFLIILFCIVLLAPFCIGQLCSGELRELADSLSTKDLSVTLSQYQTGWFTSTAKLNVVKTFPSSLRQSKLSHDVPKKLSFSADLTIYHGPVVYFKSPLSKRHLYFGRMVVVGTLHLDKSNQDKSNLLDKSNLFNAPIPFLAVLDPMGFEKLVVKLPAHQWSSAKNTSPAWKSEMGAIRMVIKPKDIHVSFGKFELQQFGKQGFKLVVQSGIKFAAHFPEKNRNGLLTCLTWTVPKISFYQHGKLGLSINKVKMQTHNTVSKHMLQVVKNFSIKSIDFTGLKLNKLHAKLSLNHLNLKPALALWNHEKTFSNLSMQEVKHKLVKLIAQMVEGSTVSLSSTSVNVGKNKFSAKANFSLSKQAGKSALPQAKGVVSFTAKGPKKTNTMSFKIDSKLLVQKKTKANSKEVSFSLQPNKPLQLSTGLMSLYPTNELVAQMEVIPQQ